MTSSSHLDGRERALPAGPFACVLADPPWAFAQWSGKTATPHRGPHDHYATTTTSDLAKIPLAGVTAEDCALFMWVVDSHFAEALALGSAWGFTFKTCALVWVKSKLGGWPKVGMGYWTRKQTEQCWLFTKGSPKRVGKGVEQIIWCPRGAHSAKPDLQYGAIERLVDGPRLELFARSRRPGWEAWGDQVGARDGALFAA
jgi:N6-adenosine-specific RNA methylase IME4